eukprot:GEMP01117128.1.p1 GENE.GEMP01117128.1~~GEMP01117128.1.p1  ORF type:complete len:174 (+),score=17.95 GEMP01117128.1:53-574(+)
MAYAFGHPNRVPVGATRDVPITPKQAAVLVVDVQRYCSEPNVGAHKDKSFDSMPYFFGRVDSMVSNIGSLLDAARGSSAEVIYTFIEALTRDGRDLSLDYKLSGPLVVPKGDPMAAILPPIAPKADDILIRFRCVPIMRCLQYYHHLVISRLLGPTFAARLTSISYIEMSRAM